MGEYKVNSRESLDLGFVVVGDSLKDLLRELLSTQGDNFQRALKDLGIVKSDQDLTRGLETFSFGERQRIAYLFIKCTGKSVKPSLLRGIDEQSRLDLDEHTAEVMT